MHVFHIFATSYFDESQSLASKASRQNELCVTKRSVARWLFIDLVEDGLNRLFLVGNFQLQRGGILAKNYKIKLFCRFEGVCTNFTLASLNWQSENPLCISNL